MALRYKDTDYIYISARVRGMENGLVRRDCYDRMLSAEDVDSAAAYLREYGYDVAGLSASEREDVLNATLKAGLREIEKDAPDSAMFSFFRYPYDCTNAKTLIKCKARGISAEGMLFDLGGVSPERLTECFEKKDYSCLPEHMAKATEEAIEAYATTKNPQKIDFLLDRACFADMAACAKESKIPYIGQIVDARADLINFMICLRILRMNCGDYGKVYAEEALLEDGKIGKKKFLKAFAEGEEALIAQLDRAGYGNIASSLEAGCSLGRAEKICDNGRIELLRRARFVTFGVEIPVAYLAALEAQIKNIRIILAGKEAGLDAAAISERMRDCYV
jgi:V/A-type H+-transporting ATPase subunit C